MPDNIDTILSNYHIELEQIFGKTLRQIILYGSYARGDYRSDSDIDLMILTSVPPEHISAYADKVYDISYDFEQNYSIEINPCIQNFEVYNHWKNVYPFFINIEREGIAI